VAYPVQLKPGMVAGDYVLKREIASGDSGTVYEAEHRDDGRKVAVKVLRRELAASPQRVARFVQEARAVNMLKHPNIVEVHAFDDLPDGRPFYAMELLDGTDLHARLNERGRFTPTEVLAIVDPVCSALQAAHDVGIVHTDLKASNILVMRRDDKQVVKLLDFGLSKLVRPELDDADRRTDIYAVGVVLHLLLTGRYPFQPLRTSQTAAIPRALEAIVLRCLAEVAEHRFPDASAISDALHDAIDAQKLDPDGTGRRDKFTN